MTKNYSKIDQCLTKNSSKSRNKTFSHLNFKCEILFHILDNHNQIRQFNAQSFPRIGRASYISRWHIGPNNFQDKTLNVRVSNSLDMSISDFFVPNLERFASNWIQNGQKTRLKSVLEHDIDVFGSQRAFLIFSIPDLCSFCISDIDINKLRVARFDCEKLAKLPNFDDFRLFCQIWKRRGESVFFWVSFNTKSKANF